MSTVDKSPLPSGPTHMKRAHRIQGAPISKMELVRKVQARWPTIGRNAALKFTMDSMQEALQKKSPAALYGQLQFCVIARCKRLRASGHAVCALHRAEYVLRMGR